MRNRPYKLYPCACALSVPVVYGFSLNLRPSPQRLGAPARGGSSRRGELCFLSIGPGRDAGVQGDYISTVDKGVTKAKPDPRLARASASLKSSEVGRLEPGTRVAVLERRQMPDGAWRCAVALEGGGGRVHGWLTLLTKDGAENLSVCLPQPKTPLPPPLTSVASSGNFHAAASGAGGGMGASVRLCTTRVQGLALTPRAHAARKGCSVYDSLSASTCDHGDTDTGRIERCQEWPGFELPCGHLPLEPNKLGMRVEGRLQGKVVSHLDSRRRLVGALSHLDGIAAKQLVCKPRTLANKLAVSQHGERLTCRC